MNKKKTRRQRVMKRNVITATLVIFACSSIFLVSSCAKKKLVTEESVITAPPAEVATAEKETDIAKRAQQEEARRAEEVRIEKLEELEAAKRREAEEKAKALQEAVAEKFQPQPIYFDFDKSSIRDEARAVLEKTAAFLKDNTSIRMRIEGNCDNRGTNEYNLALGERRANSAKLFLVSLGISPDRIRTISYGEERPLARGDSEDAWAENRRDDFVPTEE
jgi:peptidoglycan-associated lipoprotein